MVKVSKLILTIGIPGAGKSTWVEQYKRQHPYVYIISTDQIRKEITGIEQCVDPSQNGMIHEEARQRVKRIIDDPNNYGGNNGMGPEIIVDSTNVDVDEWLKYKLLNPTIMVAKVFYTTPDQAFENQHNRTRKVPLEILQMKWDRFQQNKQFLSRFFNLIM